MMKSLGKLAVATLLASSPLAVKAYDVTIDFDSLVDGAAVGATYAPVLFSSNALVTTDGSELGGGEIVQSSSPSNSLIFADGNAGTITVPNGFTVGSLNFFYANPYGVPTTVTLAGGNLGAPVVFLLEDTGGSTFDPWAQMSGSGGSVAQYITVSAGSDAIAFDDIQFNFAPPGWDRQPETQPVPEPSTVIGGVALAILAARRIVGSRK